MADKTPIEATTNTQLYMVVRPLHDRVVINLRGEIDLSNVASVVAELADHATAPWLVCDMTEVVFCGVAGAHALERAADRAAATGQRFEVIADHVVTRLLNATGLADAVTCAGDPMSRNATAPVRR